MTDLNINFNGPQSRAFRLLQPGHTVTTPWGRGVGKSWFERTSHHLLVAQWDGIMRPSVLVIEDGVESLSVPDSPGIRIVVLMPTLVQYRKVHMPYLPSEVDGKWGFLGGKLNRSDFKITYPGGSWVQVVSADAAEGSRGIRCDVVICDEADDIDPEVLEAITLAWFTEPHSLRIMLIGGTPKRGRHGLLWRAHNDWPKDPQLAATHHSIHATCYDAPKHVDREYIDTKVKPKVSTAVFRREYLCDFDSAEALVYPMFTPTFHVREPDYGTPYDEILVGVDHGFEDPGYFGVIGVIGNGKDAILHLLEEVYEQHRETSWWENQAADVAVRYARYRQRWYADPSRPDRIVDLKKAIKRALTETGRDSSRVAFEPADNSIEAGVDSLADRISIRKHERDGEEYEAARFYVSPKCVNTIREFGLYRRKRDPQNSERVLDDIVDRDNHSLDGIRYACVTRFGRPERRRHELAPQGGQYPEPA